MNSLRRSCPNGDRCVHSPLVDTLVSLGSKARFFRLSSWCSAELRRPSAAVEVGAWPSSWRKTPSKDAPIVKKKIRKLREVRQPFRSWRGTSPDKSVQIVLKKQARVEETTSNAISAVFTELQPFRQAPEDLFAVVRTPAPCVRMRGLQGPSEAEEHRLQQESSVFQSSLRPRVLLHLPCSAVATSWVFRGSQPGYVIPRIGSVASLGWCGCRRVGWGTPLRNYVAEATCIDMQRVPPRGPAVQKWILVAETREIVQRISDHVAQQRISECIMCPCSSCSSVDCGCGARHSGTSDIWVF